MPVTTFVSMILAVIAISGLTIWGFVKWGLLTMLPLLIAMALLARWGLTTVPADDGHA
jgi:hypothetical protein